jgi:hypothetical protein
MKGYHRYNGTCSWFLQGNLCRLHSENEIAAKAAVKSGQSPDEIVRIREPPKLASSLRGTPALTVKLNPSFSSNPRRADFIAKRFHHEVI